MIGKVLYLCDGYACLKGEANNCYMIDGKCRYTDKIEHATNFQKSRDGDYWERSIWIEDEYFDIKKEDHFYGKI